MAPLAAITLLLASHGGTAILVQHQHGASYVLKDHVAALQEFGMRTPNKWDLEASLADEPKGAYLTLMSPIAQAVTLSYGLAHGPAQMPEMANATIGFVDGKHPWERVHDLEANPSDHEAGIHAFSFVDHSTRRAVLAFRGSCLLEDVRQCNADRCVLHEAKSWGPLSDKVFYVGPNESICSNFTSEELDYVSQGSQLALRLQDRFPAYAVLLTGHSLGGLLASAVAALHPGVFQALTFAPSPFHDTLLNKLRLDEQHIAALTSSDIVALCDPYDCGINTIEVPLAREGAMTCVFDKWEAEPEPCHGVHNMVDDFVLNNTDEEDKAMKCKSDTHKWLRYALIFKNDILSMPADPILPTCSKDFSVISRKLVDAMRFYQLLQPSKDGKVTI